jgi:hypothetical protein
VLVILPIFKDKNINFTKSVFKYQHHCRLEEFDLVKGNGEVVTKRQFNLLRPEESLYYIYTTKGQVNQYYDFKSYTKVFGDQFLAVDPTSTYYLNTFVTKESQYEYFTLLKIKN